MHLCTQTMPFDEPLDDILSYLEKLGMDGVDLSVDFDQYPLDQAADRIQEIFSRHDLQIDVLSAVGPGVNPLHPVADRAAEADQRLRDTIRLADTMGIGTVTAFSGLPGGSPADDTPTWISTMPPYPELADARSYQWEAVAIPYWEELSEFADMYDVDVAVEVHINTLVNTPAELLYLQERAGNRIVGFLDTAHLMLQNIDPSESIRYLSSNDALAHVEISDVKYDETRRKIHGDWSLSHDVGVPNSWTLCTVGDGHARPYWSELIHVLESQGYDGPISIQQLRTPEPLRSGLERATGLLQELMT